MHGFQAHAGLHITISSFVNGLWHEKHPIGGFMSQVWNWHRSLPFSRTHWLEPNHMATLTAKKAGNCGLAVC